MNILFASSEAHPLIKTGGLADVSGSLPRAILGLHHDIRVIIPAYREILKHAQQLTLAAYLDLEGVRLPVRILSGRLPGGNVKLYLVDSPPHFDRAGKPYTTSSGSPWLDNAERFTVFCRAIHALAVNDAGLDWQPDIVHCNDWQTGLVPVMLRETSAAPASIFTIHNLAYQGLFDWKTFQSLKLPDDWWSIDALEFHDKFSFIKGGLIFADWLTTVSPTYADEICTPEFGCGLEGLLTQRKQSLTGILNGADYTVWNPGRDLHIPVQYNLRSLFHKIENKRDLQEHFALPVDNAVPLFTVISRLVEQKGIDLILEILPDLVKQNAQLVVLGSGDSQLEAALQQASARHPEHIGIHIGYDEVLAHRVEAGADIFLMPSLFEPCGLNQIYSLRYGTVPVVRRTGGLADTIVDTTPETLADKTATGFCFHQASATALWSAVERALAHYRKPDSWAQIMDTGMRQDFSWKRSAQQYVELYTRIIAQHKYGQILESNVIQ
ncbi:MAG: glycogen synthase GlgA [Gammaproteobacteria bacterium]|nr:glycogen synthase GlgA [Gammaproteobacteria bacterium]